MKQEKYTHFTDTEIQLARETDLPQLLAALGYHVTKIGSYHSAKEMDSLRIKNRRTWRRYSEQVGGDAITFMQHFHGMNFVEAVNYLLDFQGIHRAREPPVKISPAQRKSADKEKTTFHLPEKNAECRRVFAYLRKRGISSQVIQAFIKAGLIYEDKEHHNCVFVGRNRDGKAVFATKRGTTSSQASYHSLPGKAQKLIHSAAPPFPTEPASLGFGGNPEREKPFKGDVAGSDKNIAFRLPCNVKNDTVFVFETPIDLMSYCTLHREANCNAIALCGLYDGALKAYLAENPNLKHIVLCLDADEPGQRAALQMKKVYEAQGYAVTRIVPSCGKDWNEYLQQRQKVTERGR